MGAVPTWALSGRQSGQVGELKSLVSSEELPGCVRCVRVFTYGRSRVPTVPLTASQVAGMELTQWIGIHRKRLCSS